LIDWSLKAFFEYFPIQYMKIFQTFNDVLLLTQPLLCDALIN
jgi:hypothetical protein